MIIAIIILIVLIITATTIRVIQQNKLKKDKYDLSNPDIEKLVHDYLHTNMSPSEYHEKFEEIKRKTELKKLRLKKLEKLNR